jgi:acyl-CoA thioester hydrolase
MGHMNIQYYVALFNQAAWGSFALAGATFEEMQRTQTGVFALEQHICYLAEVHIGEQVTVHSRFIGLSAKRLHFIHFMVNQTRPALAATLEGVGAHIDMTTRRTSQWPTDLAQRFDVLLAQHQALAWEAPLCGSLRV